jgi:hypothetical protein
VAARRKPLSIVRAELERYAERGVFGSFSETGATNGSVDFRFNWLWKLPFHLTFDAKRQAITFKKLLPEVAPGSDLDAGVKAFLKGCSSADRPEHRRVDRDRLTVGYRNRRGTVSLTFRVPGVDYEYAVRRAIYLVNELFVGFLNLRYPEYMIKAFRLPEE